MTSQHRSRFGVPRLHVNVDHVATVRQARRITRPDPVEWALLAERAGAEGITCHLRKDRRHFQDDDLRRIRERIGTLLNLEGSLDPEMVEIGLASGTDEICLVPENRQEVTTEGGLDVIGDHKRLTEAIPRYHERGILVSLFVDPEEDQLKASAELGADFVELHTGAYANTTGDDHARELDRIARGAGIAHDLGLRVNAGHGLDYDNVIPVARLPHVEELNIGHSIVAHSLFVGVDAAIGQMLALIRGEEE
jgi:pyridoxine 5-phosphate synthase